MTCATVGCLSQLSALTAWPVSSFRSPVDLGLCCHACANHLTPGAHDSAIGQQSLASPPPPHSRLLVYSTATPCPPNPNMLRLRLPRGSKDRFSTVSPSPRCQEYPDYLQRCQCPPLCNSLRDDCHCQPVPDAASTYPNGRNYHCDLQRFPPLAHAWVASASNHGHAGTSAGSYAS